VVTIDVNRPRTDERHWRAWLTATALAPVQLPAPGRRILVVAAHPDDEVLGVGGLLHRLAGQHPIAIVWATDGEASHPGSSVVRPEALAVIRRQESQRALASLDVVPVESHHLGLPDGRLFECRDNLAAALRRLVAPGDLVLSTWREDRHPDHETVGAVTSGLGVECWQFPIWMWQWAEPADRMVPWRHARCVPAIDGAAKATAIACFTSQTEALGPEPADAAILPPHVVERFVRPFEVVFVE